MGKAYRLVRPQLTLMDIISIKGNSALRLTTSPFGLTPEEYALNPPVYVGAAAPWKGMKGPKGGGVPDEIRKNFPKVAAGLANAIKISKKYAGTMGTVLWNGKLYPRKCIEQKKG